eukprot:272855_1
MEISSSVPASVRPWPSSPTESSRASRRSRRSRARTQRSRAPHPPVLITASRALSRPSRSSGSSATPVSSKIPQNVQSLSMHSQILSDQLLPFGLDSAHMMSSQSNRHFLDRLGKNISQLGRATVLDGFKMVRSLPARSISR